MLWSFSKPPRITLEEGTQDVDTNPEALHVREHRGSTMANINHEAVSLWRVEEGLQPHLLAHFTSKGFNPHFVQQVRQDKNAETRGSLQHVVGDLNALQVVTGCAL